jgi:peptidoglycan hydrolase-like protein with peptidoglycan-binding domain
MRGADVTLLQQFLIDKGWLLVPAPTGLYGVGTEAAVAKFQLAQGLVTSRASSGYGRVGPRTMAALNAAMAGYSGDISAPPTVSMPGAPAPAASSFTRTLSVGMSGNDVLRLQRLLNSLGFTIAASGPGSPGHENTYFGPATKQALIRFQETYAQDILTPAGLTKGTGSLGPATRRKIDSF